MSSKSPALVEDGCYLLIPLKQGLVFTIHWREKKYSRQERYHLIQGYFSKTVEFQDDAKAVNIWIASIYYEARFGEQNMSELKVISDPAFSVFNALKFKPIGKEGNWVKTQVDNRFWYGQNKIKDPTDRWMVYHPQTWKPRQANFIQGDFESLAAKAFPAAIQAVASKGLKAIDATGLVAFGLNQTGLWDVFKNKTQDYMKGKLGHPLHQFNTNEPNIDPDELLDEDEEFEKTLDAALKQVKASGVDLSSEQAVTVAELISALSLGILEDVPQEPSINPVPFKPVK